MVGDDHVARFYELDAANSPSAEIKRNRIPENGCGRLADHLSWILQGYQPGLALGQRIAEANQQMPVEGRGKAFDIEAARVFGRLLQSARRSQWREAWIANQIGDEPLVGRCGQRLYPGSESSLDHLGGKKLLPRFLDLPLAVASVRGYPVDPVFDPGGTLDVSFPAFAVWLAIAKVVGEGRRWRRGQARQSDRWSGCRDRHQRRRSVTG
jgi:hypothetical protein